MARFDALDEGEAAISIVTYGELLFGVEKSLDRQGGLRTLAALTEAMPILSLPFEAARAYGVLRSDLERRGAIIGANDLWIAAHALAAGLTLVTNNVREFARVPDLLVENWAAG